ncbi:MAG: CPBP family intramembrane metalloprotease [Candidatus Methanoplasma sp.]|jgi:hypothetical protein|nr:CPBP family intramembrane metalloprotease [Candidatus Methanoplasma sp.]
MKEKCSRCDEYAGRGARFCGECGRDLAVNPLFNLGGRPLFTGCVIAAIASLVLVLVEAACLVANAPAVFGLTGKWSYPLILLAPNTVQVYTMSGVVLQAFWVFIVAALVASAAYALAKFYGDFSKAREKGTESPVENSSFLWVSVLFMATTFFSIAYGLIIAMFGLSVDASWLDDYTDREMMFLLADASVWEEVISRVLLVGVPMAVLTLFLAKPSQAPRCLLGGFGMSRAAVVLILASALVFGYAHNDGWGIEKIIPSMAAGVSFGYLYVRFGLYASILMHFLTDYLSAPQWLGLDALYVMFIILLLVLGLACFAYVLKGLRLQKLKGLPWFASFGYGRSE